MALEEYMNVLKVDNPYDYYKYSTKESFNTTLKQNISPLYQIAVNQGFEIVDKVF